MSSSLLITRFCKHPAVGAFSEITDSDSTVKVYGVEQMDNGNAPFISCIPEGDYVLVKFSSNKYGETFALHNPDLDVFAHKTDRVHDKQRYACLIHAANRFDQLQGCIAPGLGLGYIPLKEKPPIWGVKSSGKALDLLKPRLYDGMPVKIITAF